MNGFATRASLIGLWFTGGAFGLMLFVSGLMQLSAPFIMRASIKRETGAFDGADGNIAAEAMMSMAGVMTIPLLIMGTLATLAGGFVLYKCGSKIHYHLTTPMEEDTNMRAETPIGRVFAILIFIGGTILGGYGFKVRGEQLIENAYGAHMYEHARATILSIDETPVQILGHMPERAGEITGSYSYMSPQGEQIIQGPFYGWFAKRPRAVGESFSVYYHKKKPGVFEFAAQGSKTDLIPDGIAMLFVFWLMAAGLTGIKVNLGPDDPEVEDDSHDAGMAFDRAVGLDSNAAHNPAPNGAQGFGQRNTFGGR